MTVDEITDAGPAPDVEALSSGAPTPDERESRLADGADRLVGAKRSLLAHPRFLLVASATLMSIGITTILLGWVGISRSTLVEEQMPYLISGGLLGVALAVIGALMLFTHWLTVAIREARVHEAARRTDHLELVAVLTAARADSPREVHNGSPGGTPNQRPLRAAPRRP